MSGIGKPLFHQVPDFIPVIGADQQLLPGRQAEHIALHAPDMLKLDDIGAVDADEKSDRQYFEQFLDC